MYSTRSATHLSRASCRRPARHRFNPEPSTDGILDGKSVFCTCMDSGWIHAYLCVFACSQRGATLFSRTHVTPARGPRPRTAGRRSGTAGADGTPTSPHHTPPPRLSARDWDAPAAAPPTAGRAPPRPYALLAPRAAPRLRPAPEICARSFPLPAAYLGVYLVCICSEAGYARICAYLMPSPCVFPI